MLMQVGFHADVLRGMGGGRVPPDWSRTRPKQTELDVRLEQFHAEEFCRVVVPGDEHLYKVSVAIAESLTGREFVFGEVPGYAGAQRLAGLVYPAIALRGTADNVALLPEVADDSMTLEFVEWCVVQERGEDYCRLVAIDCADSFGNDGQIQWMGRPPQLQVPPGGRYEVHPDGNIVAFDASGAFVLPS